MEIARRWSGYVCPDCRFVFRVPRDHDGKGIVCPSCRRMLRIPTASDTPPPLMVPLRKIVAEEPLDGKASGKTKVRRRGKKSGSSGNHSWEERPNYSQSGRSEKPQMPLLLAGAIVLLGLIGAGVVVSMKLGEKTVVQSGAHPVLAVKKSAAEAIPQTIGRSEASYLAEMEPLARKFMEATTVEEILPLVRHPADSEARIRSFYPEGKIQAPGILQFNTTGSPSIRGKLFLIAVRTVNQEDKALAFFETAQGMKIDWENWVGWSDISWEKFLASKPTTGHVFRVTLAPVDYYNFGFSDESKWQSYRMESADHEHAVYGYVERSSVLDRRIRPAPEIPSINLMLSLKFPEGATKDSQVLIDGYVADGWVEGVESP